MPQVPTIEAPQLTPHPEMSPGIAGQPGMAIARAAEQFEGLAEYGEQESSLLKKAQDEGILLAAENHIGADMEHAESQLAAWTDYTKADELKQKTADDLMAKYGAQYQDRPDLWRHIEPYLGRELNQYNAVVDRRATSLTVDFNKGALFDAQLRAENEAATEPTLEGKERIWSIYDAKTDAMVRNGTIGADQGEAAKKGMRSRTIAAEVERAANPLNAPEIMEAELQRLKEYEGKGYVDPKDLEQMQYHLSVSYERALNRSDRIDVSRQGDAVLASLKSDPTLKDPETREFDPLAAARKVDDNPNIETKVKKYVRSELEEEAGVQSKQANDRDQKILDELDPHVESGELTFAELTRRENLAPGQKDWIPRRVADHLLTRAAQIAREDRVERVQERALAKQQAAEDSLELVAQLGSERGYLTKNDIPDLLRKNPKLKYSDALHVVEIRSAQADPNFQAGMDVFKQATNNGIMTMGDYGEATIAMLKAAQTGTTGVALIKYAQDIVQPNAEKDIKARLDAIVNPSAVAPPAAQPRRLSFFESFRRTVWPWGSSSDTAPQPPKPGDIVEGYKFKGGDPSKPDSWERQ
jgi:hypothetical protein